MSVHGSVCVCVCMCACVCVCVCVHACVRVLLTIENDSRLLLAEPEYLSTAGG